MLPPLVVGFTISAISVFALVRLAGTALHSPVPVPADVFLVIGLLCFAAIDLMLSRFRATLLWRQTPRSLSGRFSYPVTGFLWGLDTGSVFSTIRASAASWGALALVFAGWGPWWTGIAYAASFCLPMAILIATYPVAGAPNDARGWRRRSTESIVTTLVNRLKYVRFASVSVALAAVVVAVVGIAR
jgi:hypothetical protein